MELRHLEYFVAVAEELNFARAAARLKMTQPPLSQQILQLERELGVQLFQRTKRKVELTAAGEVFLREARDVLARVDHAAEQARRADRGEIGELSIGFVGSATYDILPVVVREYRRRYPHVHLSLTEMATPVQVEALARRDIDVGVLRPPVAGAIESVTIHAAHCVLAIPKGHPLAQAPSISVQDTACVPHILIARKTWAGLHDEIVSLCNRSGFTPHIVQEAFEFQTVLGLVAAGIGIAFVPPSAQNLHARDVVYRTVAGPAPMAAMAIAWRTTDASALVRNFVDIASAWEQL
ncbi:LysR family transcriptional regulator [Alicyclobacillus cycloheptanicus]|uniref:DNA-binding transcriptional LysR family regulator n=1 Tax=Alicyclobacillus cycloheptanicus TaxID=1457 RepID=A0ABT9XG68_9BACL|nr:LysR substrate-binding domain-containing protein [Alicyclobacillus cycloheptanicus]MDQ0189197.1 DNA-binding transcriptional LysR family regulator [Alicyclobacillus cycloheptanicus]WDM00383.1 LysR family transcriptional regulator [Alicyclobacillus cycloheptanicus]